MKLGVNVDHVATLRRVRGTIYPDPVEAARLCAEAGASNVTVHLREDRRHIQDRDVFALKAADILPINLEMGNAPEILRIALSVKPAEVCLVPERRQELTTEGGLDVMGEAASLTPTVEELKAAGIVVSLFVEPAAIQLEAAARLGVPYVELHTGAYCEARGDASDRELKRLIEAARIAHALGLKVNAGHGINRHNIAGILEMPHVETLNIGHSIVSRALFLGLRGAVVELLEAMSEYSGGKP
jgi:pyridoxine 5-phosphate synthase